VSSKPYASPRIVTWVLVLILILLFELAIRSLEDDLFHFEENLHQHGQRLDGIEGLLRGERLWYWKWVPNPPDEVWI